MIVFKNTQNLILMNILILNDSRSILLYEVCTKLETHFTHNFINSLVTKWIHFHPIDKVPICQLSKLCYVSNQCNFV